MQAMQMPEPQTQFVMTPPQTQYVMTGSAAPMPQPVQMQPQQNYGYPPQQPHNPEPTHVERRGSEYVGVIPTGKTPPPMAPPQMAVQPVQTVQAVQPMIAVQPMQQVQPVQQMVQQAGPQYVLTGSVGPQPGSAPPMPQYVMGGSVPPIAAPAQYIQSQPTVFQPQPQQEGLLNQSQCAALGVPYGARWKTYDQQPYGQEQYAQDQGVSGTQV
mmetsp:Transcript_31829/g.49776  ORF Transcript_31829/g.49776 Transcript_31829/m.49776 type:complete len:213 (-) Transcript_31829:49-687(-)